MHEINPCCGLPKGTMEADHESYNLQETNTSNAIALTNGWLNNVATIFSSHYAV